MRQRSNIIFLIAAIFVAGTIKADVNPTVGQTVWTIVNNLGTAFDDTNPTSLSGADAVVGPSKGTITISTTGNYILTQNLTGTCIVIDVDNVCLDLGCRKITILATDQNGITVNSSKKDVAIFNGKICNSAGAGNGSGILVQNNASQIKVINIKAKTFGAGIKLNGTDGSEITECEIVACDLVSNTIGLQLYYADENIVKNCIKTVPPPAILRQDLNCYTVKPTAFLIAKRSKLKVMQPLLVLDQKMVTVIYFNVALPKEQEQVPRLFATNPTDFC